MCGACRAQFSELLSARKLRRQLLIGIVIQLSMQFSGIDAIFYYSTIALRRAGMSNPQLATTSLGALNVGLTLVAISLMNRLGRRTLLLTAWGGMALSYVVLTCSLALAETDESGTMHYVVLLAMAGVVSSFAIGPGCIGWFVVAEVGVAGLHRRASGSTGRASGLYAPTCMPDHACLWPLRPSDRSSRRTRSTRRCQWV